MTQRARTLPRPSLILGAIAGAGLSAIAVSATAPIRVVDGDTVDIGYRIEIKPARYRLAGFDAPETRGAKCREERIAGKQATERLRTLVQAETQMVRRETGGDPWQRLLGTLRVSGEDVAAIAIREGWGHPYTGRGKRGGWCNP